MPSPGNLIPVRVRASDGSALQNCLCLTPLNLFSIINSLHFELEIAMPLYQSMARNSVILAVTSLGLTLTPGALAAYGFSRFRMPDGRVMLLGILSLLMMPRVSVIFPFSRLAHVFNIYDTLFGLVVVNTTFLLPLSTWLLKGFIDSIPIELEEAALIDGCNRMQSLWKVWLPLAVPGLIGVGTFVFINAWNEHLLAVIMTDSPSSWTLSVGLGKFFGEHVRDWNSIMALSTMTSFPLLVVFVLCQKWVVQGMTSGAVK